MNATRGSRKFDATRWQVYRERCRVAENHAPQEFREASAIGNAIPELMKRLGLEERQWLTSLAEDWPSLVGKTLAGHTRPGRYREGKLVVFVDHSAWLSELSRYGRRQLLANLQERFGNAKIRDVALQLDPDGGRRS